jgi:hypothetical protein
MTVPYLMVAAPQHPLAQHRGPISSRELAQHVQRVLSDRAALRETAKIAMESGFAQYSIGVLDEFLDDAYCAHQRQEGGD